MKTQWLMIWNNQGYESNHNNSIFKIQKFVLFIPNTKEYPDRWSILNHNARYCYKYLCCFVSILLEKVKIIQKGIKISNGYKYQWNQYNKNKNIYYIEHLLCSAAIPAT